MCQVRQDRLKKQLATTMMVWWDYSNKNWPEPILNETGRVCFSFTFIIDVLPVTTVHSEHALLETVDSGRRNRHQLYSCSQTLKANKTKIINNFTVKKMVGITRTYWHFFLGMKSVLWIRDILVRIRVPITVKSYNVVIVFAQNNFFLHNLWRLPHVFFMKAGV